MLGTVLVDADVKTIEWTGNALPTGFATSKADVVGRGVISPLQENEPILDGKLAPRARAAGFRSSSTQGKRALTMRVNDVFGVAGFVTPNTRVDVLLTIDNKSTPTGAGHPHHHAGREALAAGQSDPAGQGRQAAPVGVVTLLVTPEQAETLALASSRGASSSRSGTCWTLCTSDVRHPDQRAAWAGRSAGCRPRRRSCAAARRPRSAAAAEPDGHRGVPGRRPHAAEVLGITSTA